MALKTVKDLDEPITKTSYALFAFSAEHIGSERMHECTNCGVVIKPKQGDCCVFCSYGTVKCPPIQESGKCSCCG